MNHIHPKRINRISTHIVTIDSRDQDFSFMIVDEQAAYHLGISKLAHTYSTVTVKREREFIGKFFDAKGGGISLRETNSN
jgi:hypothetical protein